MWNTEEVQLLKELRLHPVQNSPEKLIGLIRYFAGPSASVFGVTEGNASPRVSKDLARKVRDLMRDGRLDWVLARDQKTDEGGSYDLVRSQAMMGGVGSGFLLGHADHALDPCVDMLGHWQALLPVVKGLETIAPTEPVGDRAWYWLMKPGGPGRLRRDDDTLQIGFSAEGQVEWAFLQKHLPRDPLWAIITAWNELVARDLAARRHLFRILVDLTESSPTQGGTGLRVLPDVSQSDSHGPSLHPYYALLLYDQVMA